MKIVRNEREATVYLEGIIGKMNASKAENEEFNNTLNQLYEQGVTEIRLDFTEVKGIGSTGIGKMLLYNKLLSEKKGFIKICNVTDEYIKDMFTMIHLDKIISIE